MPNRNDTCRCTCTCMCVGIQRGAPPNKTSKECGLTSIRVHVRVCTRTTHTHAHRHTHAHAHDAQAHARTRTHTHSSLKERVRSQQPSAPEDNLVKPGHFWSRPKSQIFSLRISFFLTTFYFNMYVYVCWDSKKSSCKQNFKRMWPHIYTCKCTCMCTCMCTCVGIQRRAPSNKTSKECGLTFIRVRVRV